MKGVAKFEIFNMKGVAKVENFLHEGGRKFSTDEGGGRRGWGVANFQLTWDLA